MIIEPGLIAGIMFGFEYSGPIDEDDEYSHVVIDFFFVRLVISF